LDSEEIKDERIYLGGFEIYRRNGVNPLVRETLHIMDDKQRIALVETRTEGAEPSVPAQLIRYQFGNHIGSASLELDDHAQIISYEEYTPYGSTSYHAVRSQAETPKRYRYTGMERDEQTGLSYHTARYYSPWLGRWTSSDPSGLKDGNNLYLYVTDNPVGKTDEAGTQSDDSPPPPSLDDLMLRSIGARTQDDAVRQFEEMTDAIATQPFSWEILSTDLLRNVYETVPGTRERVSSTFDWTRSFRVYLPGGMEEFRPTEINEANEQRRDMMLRLLTSTPLPSSLLHIAQETIRLHAEHSADIMPNGQLGPVSSGSFGGVTSDDSRDPDAVGFVHTHPTIPELLAPPSGGDWVGSDAFSQRPAQMMVEASSGRVWGILEPRHATLLGRMTSEGGFEPLNPLDPLNEVAFEIVDEGTLRMERFLAEERSRRE
jgi:RHS repeat-associated protein